MIATRIGCVAVAAAFMSGAPAFAQDARLFQKLAGTWTGTGTVTLLGGGPERLRCRAGYTPSGETRLHLALACASESFKMQVDSDVVRQGDGISGTWREAGFGVSGEVSGAIRGDRVDATVAGMGLTAQLSIALRGKAMVVTLASQSQLSGTANVTLRRN